MLLPLPAVCVLPVSAELDQWSQNVKQYERKAISKIHPATSKAIGEHILATWSCSHSPLGVLVPEVGVSEEHSPVPVCSHCTQERLPIAPWQSRIRPGLSALKTPWAHHVAQRLPGFLSGHSLYPKPALFTDSLNSHLFACITGHLRPFKRFVKKDPYKLLE